MRTLPNPKTIPIHPRRMGNFFKIRGTLTKLVLVFLAQGFLNTFSPAITIASNRSPAPKEERLLSIAITLPETENMATGYDHAFRLAQAAGMKTPGEITFYWNEVEQRGFFGGISYSMPFFDIIKPHLDEFNMRPVITICPIETMESRVPEDLQGLPLDNPKVLERFAELIRWVHGQTQEMNPLAIVIGNEFDLYLNHDKDKWAQFKNFFLEALQVIRRLPGWEKIPIALEPTFANLAGPDKQVLQDLNRHTDIIGVSYYPLKGDRVDDLTALHRDLNKLEALYPEKRIDFYQFGYPSSRYLGSSEEQQRRFIEMSFKEWDRRKDKIRLLTFTWLYDLNTDQLIDNARRTTGMTPDKSFTEFLGTLGLLRRKAGDEKPAFKELKKQVRARGWIK